MQQKKYDEWGVVNRKSAEESNFKAKWLYAIFDLATQIISYSSLINK